MSRKQRISDGRRERADALVEEAISALEEAHWLYHEIGAEFARDDVVKALAVLRPGDV